MGKTTQHHPPYYEGRELAKRQYEATVEMVARREERRDAMMRGFAYWLIFLTVVGVVAVALLWWLA